MNTKALLTATFIVALFSGTPVMASDDIGFDPYEFFNSEITPDDVGYDVYLKFNKPKTDVTAKKVSLQGVTIDNSYEYKTSNR